MGKVIKITHSYNLSDSFSDKSFKNVLSKLEKYFINNKDLLNNIYVDKSNNKINFTSINYDQLIDIIKKVDPTYYFKKNLIRNIELNVQFNKETKELEIISENINDQEKLNEVHYISTYNDNIRNNVYFHESSLLINYENIYKELLLNSNYKLAILYIKNDDNINYILLPYNKNTNKLIMSEDHDYSEYEILINNLNNNIEQQNVKIFKSNIILLDSLYNSILLFKNSMNNFMFENYIIDQYKLAENMIEDLGE